MLLITKNNNLHLYLYLYIYIYIYILVEAKRKSTLTIKKVLPCKKSVYLKFSHVYSLIFKKSYGASFGEASYHSVKTV